MPKPSSIIVTAAALMNDAAQTLYDNTVCIPFVNMALMELQETFELNDIPLSNETSVPITMKAGKYLLGHDTNPALPSDLIEIKQLWESQSGQDNWTPMTKFEYLPHTLENGQTISQFLLWVLLKDRITLIPANQDIDIKIDYISSIFVKITSLNVEVDMPYVNVESYLQYKTAALLAMFIAENETRSMALDSLAGTALNRSMGVKVKGMQEIVTRRRPFRAAFKSRRVNY
jgi:hypothetical protein